MRPLAAPLFVSTVIGVVILGLGFKVADPPAVQMATYATAYVDSLDEKQRAEAILPYESQDRSGWHFIPKDDRKGIPLGEMSDASRTAALRLVRSALSQSGYDKMTRVRMLESIVAELEGPDRRWARDSELYYVTLFGSPGPDTTWGLSFEGHHVSLNFVCRGGEVVDSTPQFLGTHPARVPDNYQPADGTAAMIPAGTRVMGDEEDLGFRLVRSMDASQQKQCVIDTKAPAETRFAGKAQADVDDEPAGIAFSDLDPQQQSDLRQLVAMFVDVVADPVAGDRMRRIESDGWDDIHFAWAGATQPGTGHYYRIRGKSFLIELVNSQPDAMGNPANHLHAVIRDLTGDFDLPPAE